MRSEKGLGIIGIIIIIMIIIALAVGTTFLIKNYIAKEKGIDIKQNMLSIQGACKVLKQDSIVKKNTDMFVGTKLSDMNEDNLMNDFKSKGIIAESDYEKYYCLNNDNLEQLNLGIQNEENSYYLINYDDNEVIITSGYNGKYKLSEINTEDENNQDNQESQSEENKDNQENQGEENKDNQENQDEENSNNDNQ